jgi:hypothetical protein
MTSSRDPERLVHSRAADDAELGQLLRRAAADHPAPAQVEQVVRGVLRQLGAPRPSPLRRHGPWLSVVGLLLAGGAWLASSRSAPARRADGALRPSVVASAAAARPQSSASPADVPSARLRPATSAPPGPEAGPFPALQAGALAAPKGNDDAPTRERGQAAPPVEGAPSTPPTVTRPLSAAPPASVSARAQAAPAQSSSAARATQRDRARTRARSAGAVPDDELALLARAQRALGQAPLEALTSLRAHAAAHPHGRYAEERDALVCDALARLGRSDELHAAAAAFMALHVGSPLAPRIARYLDGARSAPRHSTQSDSGPATTLIK